jgi:hypothetical protein
MNEEKLEQILNRIGRISVPPDAAGIAEQNQQSFTAALPLLGHKSSLWVKGFKMSAIAACILSAFVIGRWLRPPNMLPSSLDTASYTQTTSLLSETYNDSDDFWRQKAIAATQPRPYVQTRFTESDLINTYKQYLKENNYD